MEYTSNICDGVCNILVCVHTNNISLREINLNIHYLGIEMVKWNFVCLIIVQIVIFFVKSLLYSLFCRIEGFMTMSLFPRLMCVSYDTTCISIISKYHCIPNVT